MKTWSLLVALFLFSGSALGAAYGTAGCGLGSMVFGDDPGMVQIFAATTNGTSGNQTFGITSGTSNCAEGGKDATQFIEVNKAALSFEAAQGQGETISALSEIYGCNDLNSFGETLKANYGEVFQSQDSQLINGQITNLISNAKLGCDLV